MPVPVPDDLQSELKTRLPALHIVREALWSGNSSAGVGTAPFFLTVPETMEELEILLKTVRKFRLPVSILGAGTNMIGSDRELETVFLRLGKTAFSGIRRISETELECGAALRLAEIARSAAEMGLGGLAPLCGIPGTLGGALRMNAGANGTEIACFVRKIEGIRPDDGTHYELGPDAAGWGYRTSPLPENVLVLSAVLKLIPSGKAEELQKIREEQARRAKVTPKGRSAGSTFRNPPGTSAGLLLEKAGCKGLRNGSCHVSGQHANWIIADHEGTSPSERDLLSLLCEMRRCVFSEFDIKLQPELRFADAESERLAEYHA